VVFFLCIHEFLAIFYGVWYDFSKAVSEMQVSIYDLQAYLADRYDGWTNDQNMFMKLVEEIGEVAEVLNKRSGRKFSDEKDLQEQLGIELADMIHYIVAIAALNKIDLAQIIVEKDRVASIKYNHRVNFEQFVEERGEKHEY
jgi:NTP pyrophosphatase (non-canonical NTP hydrolase)